MSEEKKCLNREELPEGVTELSMEDLEQVTGGARLKIDAIERGASKADKPNAKYDYLPLAN